MQKRLRRRILLPVLLVFIVLFSIQNSSPMTSVRANTLPPYQELTELLESEEILVGAIAGVSVRSADTGELVYEYNSGIRLRPASNMKLLTAAAALSQLGENYRFATEVWIDGKREGKILKGNVYLKGKGDPTLLVEDLDHLAKEIKKRGIEKIEGKVIGDDSWYDGVRLSPDLIWSDEQSYYGAQISALTISPDQDYDAGTVILELKPGEKIGEPVAISMLPNSSYVTIKNRVTTASPESAGEIDIKREHGENLITVEGFLPLNSKPLKKWISVWEPGVWTTQLFKQALQGQGITVKGPVSLGTTPKNAVKVADHASMSLSELLKPFMKLSNNGHADVLVKEMGKVSLGEGSFEKGLEVLEGALSQYGIEPTNHLIRDGSGISHLTLVTANELSGLLYHVQKEAWFHVFLESLPIAGNEERLCGGTLRNRLNGTPLAGRVRAKTGTLTSVTSISGYLQTKTDKELIFSILLNNLLDEEEGKRLEDKMISILWNQ